MDHGIETLYAAPFGLSIFLVLGDVFEAHSNDVVFTKQFLNDSHYGILQLLLGEVVDN